MKLLRVIVAAASLAYARDVLTNDAILKMLKAGLGESIVVSMIQKQPGAYTLTPDELVKLKGAGVGDNVLAAMIAKGSGASPAAAAPAAQAPASDIPPNADIGVYYKKAGQWQEAPPEVVNWKTGGVLKSIGTAGIMKGDVNGHLTGAHSRTSVTSPAEFFVYTPEGVAITEYQLLRLREQRESREFRTVTGGVLHVSGGATRDVVPFEGRKVANRMYKVALSNLGAGDYGFLPPGAVTSASSASLGKMYTFHLVE